MNYYYVDDVIETLRNAPRILVFGAGNVARGIVHCLTGRPYCFSIEYCLVSEKGKNLEEVEGVPVISCEEAGELVHKDALILIAVMEKYLAAVMDNLHSRGFFNTLSLTYENDLWSLLRGNVYRDYCLSRSRPYLTVEEELEKPGTDREISKKTIHIYRACCHVDRKLEEDISRFSWEIPIQVGAALTEQRICDTRDDTGENISYKNRQYCELTALYWIWKNDRADYVGLGHYRRHFELDAQILERLADSDIDVVLTIPIMGIPDVETVYRRDHIGADWDVMEEAVEKLFPEYSEALRQTGSGIFYHGYNMFIMGREILENYCQWLFSILSYCENHCEVKEDTYQNRYIGFLAERLMSVYFLHHEKDYKIVHGRKHFIER